jgi:hypothetical protein
VSSFYATDGADAERRAVSCDCLAHRHGNAAYRPVRQPTYPTDASDAEWAAAVSMIPVPAWMGGRGGRPEGYCHREMLDAVRYVVDNGIKWHAAEGLPVLDGGVPVLPALARSGPAGGVARPAAPGVQGPGGPRAGAGAWVLSCFTG